MPTPATTELPLEAARALAAHLRQHPDDAARPAQELAAQFGLRHEFVRSVLAQVQPPVREERSRRGVRLEGMHGLGRRLLAGFDRATVNPSLFVAVTLAIGLLLTGLLSSVAPDVRVTPRLSSGNMTFSSLASFLTMLGTVALHMACYLRRAMTRYALFGAVIFWAGTSIPLMVLTWVQARDNAPLDRALVAMAVALGMLVVSAGYAGLGALFAVLGAWFQQRSETLVDERLTRQELLERYFDLQSRLEKGVALQSPHPWLAWPVIAHVRRSPMLWAAVANAVLTAFVILLAGYLKSFENLIALVVITQLVAMISKVTVFLTTTFLAGGPVRALATASAYIIAGTATDLGLRLSGLAPLRSFNPLEFASMLAFLFACALIAGLGWNVQEQAARTKSLRGNDQATLLGEMLRIQWRLNDEASTVCVMVVDAAKSAEMKQSADPMVVEYSFREYQSWIADVAEVLEGHVISTAGDGAVASFPTCQAAFAAARRLQADLDRFNRECNRLPSPFRLRVGLHVGAVPGDLDEVQYTEVIDIAAHVQGAAPVGGIAVTDDVVAGLEMEDFIPLARTVDGHAVFLALDPTDG